jgi:phage shock protein E
MDQRKMIFAGLFVKQKKLNRKKRIMRKLLVMVFGVMLLVISGCCLHKQCKFTPEKNAVLLDVRTPEEHKNGYLDGAILIPLAELESKISGKVPSKSAPIYIYCRSGRRAVAAVEKLKSMGYANLHNLGGLHDAQEKFNLPIKK